MCVYCINASYCYNYCKLSMLADNTVSTFFQLLGSFIVNSEEHEDHLLSTNSIPTISALVQKVSV